MHWSSSRPASISRRGARMACWSARPSRAAHAGRGRCLVGSGCLSRHSETDATVTSRPKAECATCELMHEL
eukprot:3510609-Prymnesium_polylepis.1